MTNTNSDFLASFFSADAILDQVPTPIDFFDNLTDIDDRNTFLEFAASWDEAYCLSFINSEDGGHCGVEITSRDGWTLAVQIHDPGAMDWTAKMTRTVRMGRGAKVKFEVEVCNGFCDSIDPKRFKGIRREWFKCLAQQIKIAASKGLLEAYCS